MFPKAYDAGVDWSREVVTAPDCASATGVQSLEKLFVVAEKDVEGTACHLEALAEEVLVRVGELYACEGGDSLAAAFQEFRGIEAYPRHGRDVVEVEGQLWGGLCQRGKPLGQLVHGGGLEEGGGHGPYGVGAGGLGSFRQGLGVGKVVVPDVSDVEKPVSRGCLAPGLHQLDAFCGAEGVALARGSSHENTRDACSSQVSGLIRHSFRVKRVIELAGRVRGGD